MKLVLWVILKVFLNFNDSEPQYSYKLYLVKGSLILVMLSGLNEMIATSIMYYCVVNRAIDRTTTLRLFLCQALKREVLNGVQAPPTHLANPTGLIIQALRFNQSFY